MTERFEMVPFEDHQILTATRPEGVYVVMKPIVEAFGLAWHGQFERIRRHPVLSEGVRVIRIPSSGGMQDAVTLHLEQFHGWVVTLNPLNVRDDDRRAVIVRYQQRAFRVIFEHFHGPLSRPDAIQPDAIRIAMQNQAIRLAEKLERATNPGVRAMIHEMLSLVCGEIGITTPALHEIGREKLPSPDMVAAFWSGIAVLQATGVDYNHSRSKDLIAVALPEIREWFRDARIDVAINGELSNALRQCEAPRFIDYKQVNSRLIGGTKMCWVFALNS